MSSPNEHNTDSAEEEKRKMREDMEGLGTAAKSAAEDAGERLRSEFDEFRDEMAEEGSRLTGAAADEAYRFAEGRKAAAADAIHDLAGSVRESAHAFEDRPNLQAFFDSAAEGLDGFAATVQDRTFAQLYADAEDFARKRPVAVALGAGLVGLLMTRLARSSGLRARLEEERHAAEQRWTEREAASARARGDF